MRASQRLGGAVLLFGGVLLAQPRSAQAADPKPATTAISVGQVIQAMSDYLAKAKGFSFHAEIEFDKLLPKGPKIRLAGAADAAVLRPGSLAVHYRDDLSARDVWFADGRATILDPQAGTYAEVSGPKDIDGMVAKLEDEYRMTLPLAELLTSNPEKLLTRGADQAFYVGVHDVEGVPSHHLVFRRDDLDWQVFVEVGDKPLLRKLVIEYPKLPGSPQYSASLMDWSFELPKPELFAAKLPKAVARVEFLAVREVPR